MSYNVILTNDGEIDGFKLLIKKGIKTFHYPMTKTSSTNENILILLNEFDFFPFYLTLGHSNYCKIGINGHPPKSIFNLVYTSFVIFEFSSTKSSLGNSRQKGEFFEIIFRS